MPTLPGGLPLGFPGQPPGETLSYTSALTGQTITFGDQTLPTVVYKGVSGHGIAANDNYAVDLAYRPGSQFVRTKKTATQMKVDLAVFGDPNAPDIRLALFSTVNTILGVLEPATTQAGALTKVTTDGTARQLRNVQYVGGFEVQDLASNRAYVDLELLFECYDPSWYSTTQHVFAVGATTDIFGFAVPITVPLTINGQANATVNCPNNGNINAYPIFTFTGPLQNYSISNGNTGLSFSITQPLNQGDMLVVDTVNGAITYTPSGSAAVPLYSSFGGNRQWVLLAPGPNNITFRRDAAGNNQCQVSWFDTWNHG